jgi:hypothetical protein
MLAALEIQFLKEERPNLTSHPTLVARDPSKDAAFFRDAEIGRLGKPQPSPATTG